MSGKGAMKGDYEAIYRELDRLDALLSSVTPLTRQKPSTKSKSKSIADSLDTLLGSLNEIKGHITSQGNLSDAFRAAGTAVDTSKKEIEERQKEVYNSLNRMGRAIEKKFPEQLPAYDSLFASPEASAALDRVVGLHLLRTGEFEVADVFLREASVDLDEGVVDQFQELHRIVHAIRNFDLGPALEWCRLHRPFLGNHRSPLEFNLHRSRYIRLLLLLSKDEGAGAALNYARRHFPPLYAANSEAILRLISALAFLPASRLASSPYSDLTSPSIHAELETQFEREYCNLLKMSRQLPLRVVGDLGGSGALSKIERGKRVILDKKTEWSASDELPVEIPVPSENQYHSIFACPVSKELATENNPPMMLTCGHVLAKESIMKMQKNGTRIKCPYCPIESTSPPQRVWF